MLLLVLALHILGMELSLISLATLRETAQRACQLLRPLPLPCLTIFHRTSTIFFLRIAHLLQLR